MSTTQITTQGLEATAVTAMTQGPEFYGFRTDANNNLIVETTNLGADTIADTTIYSDHMINIQGITFQINTTTGNLEMTL
jgi:hypothetical protein